MIIVIQCAAGKQHDAGHLRAADGRKVMFVADPDHDAVRSACSSKVFARPDDISDTGKPWRAVLQEYNEEYRTAPEDNPLRLLRAWRLYRNRTYRFLADHWGEERFYILSAGWGLIRADFLTPKYDITFSKARNVEPFKRRGRGESYADFRLPSGITEPIVFFGGRDYIPLFCELTANTKGDRIIFYAAGSVTDAPGCTFQKFERPSFTNWHYGCARDFVKGKRRI